VSGKPATAIRLAFIHATRPGSKTILIGFVAALVSLSLVLALCVGDAIAENTRRFIVDRYSGELVVAEGPSAALFGYAVITGNERQTALAREGEVRAILGRRAEIASIAPLLTGYLDLVPAEGQDERCIAFGVDAEGLGPRGINFRLKAGSRLPGPGEILLSSSFAARLSAESGRALLPGDILTASALKDAGLGVKALKVSGLYEYDGGVSELDRIAFLDGGTAAGLILGEEGLEPQDKQEVEAVPTDDEVFSAEAPLAKVNDSSPLPIPGPVAASRANGPHPWHYLRLRLLPGTKPGALAQSLNASFAAAGLGAMAIDWRGASSGYADTAQLVRTVALSGIAVAALFALLILANALALLVDSRAGSINTLRAIGASGGFIFSWTALEGFFASAWGATAGALLGWGLLSVVSRIAPRIASPMVREIFAQDRLVIPAGLPDIALALALATAAVSLAVIVSAIRGLRGASVPE
jgi:ABC-type lipoprotein release transport system permease subunit